jgi:hypothetical protein
MKVLAIIVAAFVCSSSALAVDTLTVHGNDFAFSVSEPAGWHGDTSSAARYHVNIVFYPSAKESRKADITIRVRVNSKVDEDIAGDLRADMDGYKTQYPQVQFADLPVKNASYPVWAKLFFVPQSFYEYVAYLNPGPSKPITLSAAMSVRGRRATESELAAYGTIVESLRVVSPPQHAPSFQEALVAARSNESANPAFDETVGKTFGSRHAGTLQRCTSGVAPSDLKPFDLLIKLSQSGQVETALVGPETAVAKCVHAAVASELYPAPPRPEYWVRVHLAIAP